MNLIRPALGVLLVVAWCGGSMKERGLALMAPTGSPQIDSIILRITQGGDGKAARTGFRMDVDAGNGTGISGDPMFTVYTCGTEDRSFDGHSTADVVLKPVSSYRGRVDLAALRRAGGRIHVWPICYAPESAGDPRYDVWDITEVVMTICLRPAAGGSGPGAVGGPDGSLVWDLDGPKMLVLSSEAGNEADLYFDANFKAAGSGW